MCPTFICLREYVSDNVLSLITILAYLVVIHYVGIVEKGVLKLVDDFKYK
jgi:hypothetical protein